MCGIVGYVGTQAASEILLEGLRKLEYRGYDSAGIATVWEGQVHCVRAKGKLQNLQEKLEGLENPAQVGIGHTRWATHGKPEEYNAHHTPMQPEKLPSFKMASSKTIGNCGKNSRQKATNFAQTRIQRSFLT